MSDAAPTPSLKEQIASRWQIPLLVFSILMLLAGVWRLRPHPEPPSFEQLFADARALAEAGLYPEASDYAARMLEAPERLDDERRQLHGFLARVIFEYEQRNVVHGEQNARRILQHSDAALAEGESHDAKTHKMRGQVFEWLRRPAQALQEYEQALAKGADESWALRRRMITIRQTIGVATPEYLHAAYDQFLTEPDVSHELRYWAVEQRVELFGRDGKHDEAEQFLAQHAHLFQGSDYQGQFDYLQALTWYHRGRLDDVERVLRALRDSVSPADPLYAGTGWLLGKVLQKQEAPEFALSFYSDVVANTVPGPYRTASLLGQAEVLSGLERFDESIETYKRVIRLTTDDLYGSLVDLREVRVSTTSCYQALLARGKLAEAMAYLQIAAALVPPADVVQQALYARWLGELALALGRSLTPSGQGGAAASLSEAGSADDPTVAGRQSREYLREAGRHYLRLAQLTALDEGTSSDATWRAADAFDEAADRQQVAEVLERFVQERRASTRVPQALHRLGQTYQALGDFQSAIARYQQNLVQFPSTLSAVASLIPLADCFVETGALDKAEQTLLRIVSYRPEEPVRTMTPAAREYGDALFRLGDLYSREGRFEGAITHYEEALERYQNDSRSARATFLLAEAYRLSAAQIRQDLQDNKHVAYRDHLRITHQERLRRARQLYEQVVDRHAALRSSGPRSTSQASGPVAVSNSGLDDLYVKLSHLYQADVVYDLSRVADPSDLGPYAESLELYDRAAWVYQNDPMAMTAYVQIINCHLRMGNIQKARMTLQRAKWALKGIPDKAFVAYAPDEGRAYWEHYLTWLEKTPTFRAEELVGS